MPGLLLSQARDLAQLNQEIQLGFKRDLKNNNNPGIIKMMTGGI